MDPVATVAERSHYDLSEGRRENDLKEFQLYNGHSYRTPHHIESCLL